MGQPISMAQNSLPSLEQATKDFLKRVTRMAKRDNSCSVLFLSVTVISSASQSVTLEKLSFIATAKEEKDDDEEEECDGGCCCSW